MNDIQLREVRESDLPFFFELQQDPIANRMQAFTADDPADRAAFDAKWAAILRDDSVTKRTILYRGKPVGYINAFLASWSGQREVGYRIDRKHWGRGIVSTALLLFLKCELTRPLFAQAASDNAGSIRVLAKCGFQRCGTARGFAQARGAEIEEIVLRLDGELTTMASRLLGDLANTFIGLAPSPIHGIGVFALADIPAGKSDLFSPMTAEWPAVPLAEVERLPAPARKLIDTYCLHDEGMVYLPPNGFKIVDLVVFLNHSDTPNLRQMDGGNYFVTLRDIAAGEELLIDYGSLEIE